MDLSNIMLCERGESQKSPHGMTPLICLNLETDRSLLGRRSLEMAKRRGVCFQEYAETLFYAFRKHYSALWPQCIWPVKFYLCARFPWMTLIYFSFISDDVQHLLAKDTLSWMLYPLLPIGFWVFPFGWLVLFGCLKHCFTP